MWYKKCTEHWSVQELAKLPWLHICHKQDAGWTLTSEGFPLEGNHSWGKKCLQRDREAANMDSAGFLGICHEKMWFVQPSISVKRKKTLQKGGFVTFLLCQKRLRERVRLRRGNFYAVTNLKYGSAHVYTFNCVVQTCLDKLNLDKTHWHAARLIHLSQLTSAGVIGSGGKKLLPAGTLARSWSASALPKVKRVQLVRLASTTKRNRKWDHIQQAGVLWKTTPCWCTRGQWPDWVKWTRWQQQVKQP